jgi:hypothetical protein
VTREEGARVKVAVEGAKEVEVGVRRGWVATQEAAVTQ